MPKSKVIKNEKVVTKKPAVKKTVGLSVPCFSLAGTKVADLELPKEIFGAKVNKPLLAQAIRVYQNNLLSHHSHTKTRSEVKGSTRKIRVQKGTGGARHGGIRAPIFVGGGIATGPKYRKVYLDLPQKMKKAALVSALSDKMAEKEILGVVGLEKATGKTKEVAKLMGKFGKKSVLFVSGGNEKFQRAARNLPKVAILPFSGLNAYNVSLYQTVIFNKDALKVTESKEKK
ncbi:MAG: 50S ribosomal protein L4 [Candidatus Daviesbacteria bacterium GW2011_GWB1_41_5]|uniref:Large ribosomal subunit protein uL4 n=1 Tax=Candidatus Daviesbacteria bacterium GW2011_GWB1_41_5 TaxID=1618429 RepID=A0A0G0WJL5_9BACT|nr:MAG: 50S ribosomal protein L4 [Candidatus Daviesbacteria bacterium GW2011_GWB1_41_5]